MAPFLTKIQIQLYMKTTKVYIYIEQRKAANLNILKAVIC